MDITTEVGLTYLCQQIYTVLAKRSIVFSMNLRTCLGYTTRLNPISHDHPPDSQVFSISLPPRLAGFRFSGSQSPATLTKRQAHESLRTKRMAQ